jgi:hypothetical protein
MENAKNPHSSNLCCRHHRLYCSCCQHCCCHPCPCLQCPAVMNNAVDLISATAFCSCLGHHHRSRCRSHCYCRFHCRQCIFKTPWPLSLLAPPPLPLVCQLVVATPIVALPPPLVLLMLRRLLSTDVCLLVCLLFTSWLSHCPCCRTTTTSCSLDAPPPSCNAQLPLIHFSSRLPLVCRLVVMLHISLHCLHLVSPCVVQPPHVSILDPPPSFAPASCRAASHRTASASCPLINISASQRAATSHHFGNSTSCWPLVLPNWLPHCLFWPLCLTSTSLPSPPPLPLVAYCSRLPRLVVVLSHVNLQLSDCQPPLPFPLVVGCCVVHPLRCLPPIFVFSPTAVHHAVIDAANAMAWVNFQLLLAHQ